MAAAAPISPATGDLAEREAQLYMRTFVRIPVALARGEGVYVWDVAGNEYLDFFWRDCGQRARPLPSGGSKRGDGAGADAHPHHLPLLHVAAARAGAAAGRELLPRPRLLCEQRRRGHRNRDQAGPQVGQAPSQRRLPDHHRRELVSWPHARLPGRDRPAPLPPRLCAAAGRVLVCPVQRSRRLAGGRHR